MEHRTDLTTMTRNADPLAIAVREGVARGRALHGEAVRCAFTACLRFLVRSARLRRTRDHLARLDDRALRDVGLNPADARKESQKPFWRV